MLDRIESEMTTGRFDSPLNQGGKVHYPVVKRGRRTPGFSRMEDIVPSSQPTIDLTLSDDEEYKDDGGSDMSEDVTKVDVTCPCGQVIKVKVSIELE